MDWRFVTRARSGRGAWGVRRCEPLGAAVLGRYRSLKTSREDHGRVPIKLQTDPLYWSIISTSVTSCVALYFSLAIYPFSPIKGDLIFDGFDVLPTDC